MENALDPVQEQLLIERVQQHQDSAAFRLLYNQYFPKVYAYVGYRVPITEDTEDLVAETFLRVLKNLEAYEWRGEGSFAAWLFAIAHNLVSNYYRSHAIRQEQVDLSALDRLAEDPIRPLDVVSQRQRVVALQQLIRTLSPRRQEVITLKFFGGLRNKEIATLLGLDERTVASHLSRGLRDLYELYEQRYSMTQEGAFQ